MLFHLLAVSGLASRIRFAGSTSSAVVVRLNTHAHAIVLYCLKTWDKRKLQSSVPPIKMTKKINKKPRSCATLLNSVLELQFPPFELICSIGCHCLPSAQFCCVLICFDILNDKKYSNINESCVLFALSLTLCIKHLAYSVGRKASHASVCMCVCDRIRSTSHTKYITKIVMCIQI